MRKQALLGLLALLGICVSVRAAAVAADERPATVEKSVVSRTDVADVGVGEDSADLAEPGIPAGIETPILPPDTVFNHVIVAPDGKVIEAGVDANEGGVAGPGEHIIYANTLGIHTINLPNNQPVSDDISTIAPDGCKLTRYKFKVLGKVLSQGTCLGGTNANQPCALTADCPGGTCSLPPPGTPYTVTYGLYTNCPLAVGNTNAQRDVVKIPGTDGVLSFPDDAPRTIEHIVDSLTPVELPNNVYLSLRFNRSNCGTVIGAPALTGYSGDIWDFPGFACNGFLGGFPQLPHASYWLEMYGTTNCAPAFSGYKCQRPSGGVATIGANIQGVDDIKLIVNNCQMVGYEVVVKGVGFYTFDLRRDCDGNIVPGTERTFSVNASTTPLLQVARFTFNPPITLTTDSLFFGFRCSSNSSGAVIAGIQPIIGESESDYSTIGLEGCAPVIPTQGVHGAVNLAITCQGAQPIGACCDPHMTQCKGGPDDGKRCPANALCVGGTDDGKDCSPSKPCASPGVCTPFCGSPGTCESVCRQTAEINCPFPPRGQDQQPKWILNGICGANPDPFGSNPCGVAACCHLTPDDANPTILHEVCDNLTRNQCDAAIPTNKARLWQLGEYCGLNAQRCPRNACLARQGSCYIAHTTPGCDDPFCCSDVCAGHGTGGAFCCNTAWDDACVAFAQQDCISPPENDQCAPDFPVRGLEGALAIPVPGSKTTNNLQATESQLDPGFCCNSGTGVCVGGFDEGQVCVVDTDCTGTGAHCTERFPSPGAPALGTLWFKFTQPANSTSAGIQTCGSNSPALDSVLQVFEAQDNSSQTAACNSLSMIGCNDDAAGCSSTGRNSKVCLRGLTPGKTYYILLGAKTPNRLGMYTVVISTSCSGPTTDPIANDYCRNATNITDPTPENPLVVPFALGRFCLNAAAAGKACTTDTECRVCVGGLNAGQVCTGGANCPGGTCPTVPVGTCPTAGPTFECPAALCSPSAQEDIWYNYTASCTGEATFSTCGPPGEPDTNIAIYEGCTTCPVVSAPEDFLACNRDAELQGCFTPGRVVTDVVAGQCYKVRLSNEGGFPVGGNLTITCPPIICSAPGIGDCQPNGVCDDVDIATCPAGNNDCKDCNGNQRPDVCDIRDDLEQDCQPNGRPDLCELVGNDCQPDGIPDDCVCEDPCCDVGGCVTSVPANCSVDARRPHAPNAPGTLQGINSVAMTGSASCSMTGAVPANFAVTCTPAGAPCPTVNSVNVVAQTATVGLSSVIPAGKWTCIKHNPSNQEVCLGSLPGDCGGNLATAPADILDLIDHLNGIRNPPLNLDHCDMDRSGACLGADIISIVDMLNGTNAYIVWNGKTLSACPSAP